MKWLTVRETTRDGNTANERVVALPADFTSEDVQQMMQGCPSLPDEIRLSKAEEIRRNLRITDVAEYGFTTWRLERGRDWQSLGSKVTVAALILAFVIWYFFLGDGGGGGDYPENPMY